MLLDYKVAVKFKVFKPTAKLSGKYTMLHFLYLRALCFYVFIHLIKCLITTFTLLMVIVSPSKHGQTLINRIYIPFQKK